jgi:hypothetical protein
MGDASNRDVSTSGGSLDVPVIGEPVPGWPPRKANPPPPGTEHGENRIRLKWIKHEECLSN